MIPLAQRMELVQSPIIPVVAELIRNHPGTISLGQGVVHYPPPRQAIDRITEFLAEPNNHKYQPVDGVVPLRKALERKLAEENGIAVDPAVSRIFVSAGGNLAFMNIVFAIADPADEFILLAPYYFNYEMAIVMASCKPVVVETDENYQPRIDAIRQAVTPRTRAIVTISPNNPTGAVYPEPSLRAINDLCRQRGIYHVHDEVYEYFLWNDARHFSPGSLPGAGAHTFSIYSLSKAYGFASWRVGYMVAPTRLYDALRKAQDTMIVCPPVISQYAGLGAIEAGRPWCQGQLQSIREVRGVVAAELVKLRDRCTVPPADGAFYYLLNVHTNLDPMTVTERLVREHGVAVIPGTTFGMNHGCYLRVAYGALKKDTAAAGIGRLVKGLQTIV